MIGPINDLQKRLPSAYSGRPLPGAAAVFFV